MASHRDSLLHDLAQFAHTVPLTLDPASERAARFALTDSLAVALGALRHPAAIAARRYAQHAVVASGATLWGTGECVTAEVATLANGVPLRGYDYNDLYIGRSGGHPSDIIPGALAIAQWRQRTGAQLLASIALGYEAQILLFDALDLDSGGWDYPVVTALGATCGYARLLGLSLDCTREALAIVATKHLVSDEVESGELNLRGDLTMWKRFNGSNACRQAVAACLLATAGVEGAVRPFEGHHGVLTKLGATPADRNALLARLGATRHCSQIQSVTFKRWPVGSRAQSAIQAALEAHDSLRAAGQDPAKIQSIRIRTDRQVYEHLIARRAAPFQPVSRETADHSLAYVVTAAVLDGRIGTDSFNPDRVLRADIQTLLASRVSAQPDPTLSLGASAGFLSEVEVIDAQGRCHCAGAHPPPGHRLQPFSETDIRAKFIEAVTPTLGSGHAATLLDRIVALGSDDPQEIDRLCRALVPEDPRSINQPAA
jgi:2-methylcitrate dehydratase